MKKFLLLICLNFFSQSGFSQCNFQALGPNDYKQPSFHEANNTQMVTDGNGTIYIGYIDGGADNGYTVKKYTGNNTWETVGTNGVFAESLIFNPTLAVHEDGTLYAAFNAGENRGKVVVIKFNGTTWTKVGSTDLSAGQAEMEPSLALNPDGIPYVAYGDISNGSKVTVKKFDGTNWVPEGSGVLTASTAYYQKIAIDNNGIPYVLYSLLGYGNVKKFDGTNWVTVGNADFTTPNRIYYTELAIDNNNVPFIAHTIAIGVGHTEDSKTSVMKYDGSSWVQVGSPAIGNGINNTNRLTFNKSNTPYLTFCQADQGVFVKKYNGSDWESIGDVRPLTSVGYSSIITDQDDALYVCYNEKNSTLKAVVKKFENNSWNTVGSVPLSEGVTGWSQIHVSSDGTPYVIYQNGQDFNRDLAMKKFNGSEWVDASAPKIIEYSASQLSTAMDRNDVPYIAYCYPLDEKLTVKKFDGNAWSIVGDFTNVDGTVDVSCLTFDKNNTPYILYADAAIGMRGVIKKFDGTSWVPVGDHLTFNGLQNRTIVVDDNGIVYIGFRNEYNGVASVMKYDGSAWTFVGSEGFSLSRTEYTSLTLDDKGVPYLAYSDFANDKKITVKKFDGTNWVTLGTQGFSAGQADYITLSFDHGKLYASFKDYANQRRATLMQFDGADWVPVATAFSAGYANFLSLDFDADGRPFAAYSNGGTYAYGFCYPITDIQTPGSEDATASLLSLYPNPNNGTFSVELKKETTVFVTNSYGQVIWEKFLPAGKTEIDLSAQPKGLYLVKSDVTSAVKFVKE